MTVYLHAGTHKTGSKSLQALLSDSRQALLGPVAATLAGLSAHVFSVLLPPCEAIYATEPRHALEALATRLFRTPCPHLSAELASALYGDCSQLTAHGLAGHRVGKSIVRCGVPIGMDGIHRPLPADPSLTALVQLDGFEIAASAGLTVDREPIRPVA